jgi:hypothetical protein
MGEIPSQIAAVAIAFGLPEMRLVYRYTNASLALSSATTVLKSTRSIIAHINNNATLNRAAVLSIRRGMAAVPLPAPRSVLMGAGGRRSETRGEFCARSHSRTSRRPGLAEKRPPPGRGRRSEPVVELAEAAFRGPAGSHGPEGERSTPDQAGGKTQVRPKGGPFRHWEGHGERGGPKAVTKALRTVARAWAGGGRRNERP